VLEGYQKLFLKRNSNPERSGIAKFVGNVLWFLLQETQGILSVFGSIDQYFCEQNCCCQFCCGDFVKNKCEISNSILTKTDNKLEDLLRTYV
jgi:hypothetical protein